MLRRLITALKYCLLVVVAGVKMPIFVVLLWNMGLGINSSVLIIGYSLFLTCFYTFFHRVVACCRGIKLLLIRRSRLALVARLRRFCVCPINESRLLYWCSILWMICLALKFSVLFIGNSLFLTCFYTFFHRVKEPKRPAHAKISHNSLLLTSRKRHPSFGCGAKAHSFVKLKLQSSQTLLARNGVSNSFSFNHRGQKNSLFTQ